MCPLFSRVLRLWIWSRCLLGLMGPSLFIQAFLHCHLILAWLFAKIFIDRGPVGELRGCKQLGDFLNIVNCKCTSIDATIGKLYCSGWSRSWEWRKLIVCWNLIIKPDTVVIGEFENFKVFIRKPPKLNQSYFANRENLIRCIKHNGPFLHFLFLYFSNFVRAMKNTKIN